VENPAIQARHAKNIYGEIYQMLNPKCWICSKPLEDFGALYFEPPRIMNGINGDVHECRKHHLCKACNEWILTIVRTRRE
jgi:hypothetical protein